MRRIAVIVVALAFAVSAAPVFAGDTPTVKAGNTKVVLPFQPIADTFKPGVVKPKNKLRWGGKTPSTQQVYNDIKNASGDSKSAGALPTK